MQLILPQSYNYVIWTAVAIAIECFFIGFIIPGRKRGQVFTQEFLEKNFKEIHEAAFPGQALPKGGYPDTGNGFYSRKLSYKEWFEFNLAQRAHLNFVEQVFLACFLVLVAGVKYPIYASIAGSIYFVGRILYAIGYSSKVEGRLMGVLIGYLGLFPLFVMGIMSPLSL